MLIISTEQLAALDSTMLERDVSELAKRLERDHPKEIALEVPLEARLEFVRESHEEAKSCGLRTKEQIYLFAEARLLFGIGFHKDSESHPTLVSCLQDSAIGTDEKVGALSEELAFSVAFASK